MIVAPRGDDVTPLKPISQDLSDFPQVALAVAMGWSPQPLQPEGAPGQRLLAPRGRC